MDDVLDIFELVDDMSDGFVPPTIAESATNFTPRVFIRSSIISLFTREFSISSYTHTHTQLVENQYKNNITKCLTILVKQEKQLN